MVDGVMGAVRSARERARGTRRGDLVWRIGVGIVGFAVLVAGIVMIPYPGPGWVVVFAGLGILASEFVWAKRLLAFARRYYDAFTAWFGRQNFAVKGLFGLLTCVVVIVTLWLLGAIGMVAGWVGLHGGRLQSPLAA